MGKVPTVKVAFTPPTNVITAGCGIRGDYRELTGAELAALVSQLLGITIPTPSYGHCREVEVSGVTFTGVYQGSWRWRARKFIGINLQVGSYGEKTHRREMLAKDGTLDATLVRVKFDLLAREAVRREEKKKAERASSEKYGRERMVLAQMWKQVTGRSDEYSISPRGDDGVKLDITVSRAEFTKIMEVLKKQ